MRKKGVFFILGGVAIVALLGGAAFMTMRLLNSRVVVSSDPVGSISGKVTNGKGPPVQITFDPAPELPKIPVDLVGEVTSTADNSVFVSEKTKSDAQSSPPMEVVLTRETKIYRDVTLDNVPPPAASRRMQQVVQLVDRGQIARTDILEIWGEQRGDRLNADVIVIHGPDVIQNK